MASSSSSSHFFFLFISLLLIFPFVSSVTIPLSLSSLANTPQNPYQRLNFLVSSSITRARNSGATSSTLLFPHSYGGYSISLSIGTPPQTIPVVFDTGSDVVWFPCTSHYICLNCSFPNNPPPNRIPSFVPKNSASSKLISCRNPKCSWIHRTKTPRRNKTCHSNRPNSKTCNPICPSYEILYGSGITGGVALSETLNLPNSKTVPDFLVGCSVFSLRQPAGIAGFGRGPASLPGQLKFNKFSYCLVSHKFDDTNKTGSLVLYTGSDSDKKTRGVKYTPFLKNPRVAGNDVFLVYYYVVLRKITVGDRRVKIPYKYLTPSNDGNGGTIVDSGSTFTYMARDVFKPLVSEIESQVRKNYNYSRNLDVERSTGLRPCFNVERRKVVFPEMSWHFKGGAEMALPLENYFSVIRSGGNNSKAVCLMVISDDGEEREGPAIILGNYQMQNYYVEYDLRNERFGFKQQRC